MTRYSFSYDFTPQDGDHSVLLQDLPEEVDPTDTCIPIEVTFEVDSDDEVELIAVEYGSHDVNLTSNEERRLLDEIYDMLASGEFNGD